MFAWTICRRVSAATTRPSCCHRLPETTPCARGRAGTRAWCGTAPIRTSARRAACSASAITRWTRICATARVCRRPLLQPTATTGTPGAPRPHHRSLLRRRTRPEVDGRALTGPDVQVSEGQSNAARSRICHCRCQHRNGREGMTRRMFQLGGVVTQAMIVAIVGGGTAAARTPAQGLPPMHVKPIKQVSGRAELGLTVSVSSTDDGGVLLSATAGDLSFRKVVYADGRYHAQIEQGRDRIAFAGSAGRQVVTYGSRSLTLSADQDDQQPARVRALIVSSPALRQFRRLVAQLEATGDVSPEILGLRVTGAVGGENDGGGGGGGGVVVRVRVEG